MRQQINSLEEVKSASVTMTSLLALESEPVGVRFLKDSEEPSCVLFFIDLL